MLNLLKNVAGALAGIFFGIASTYAIKGGPEFPAGTNVVGTYAGVLTPKASPCPSISPEPMPACTRTLDPCAANSIGVFSVGAPENGVATGAFVMFAQGRVFNGTINGVADPGRATLKGILAATFNFNLTIPPEPCPACTQPPEATTIQVTATANGNLKTRIKTTSNGSTGATSIRIKGTGALDISHGQVDAGTLEPIVACEIPMKITGFKQSNTVATTTTTTQ